mmetsp:Transcript_8904/g.17714  ORF Transcript_8904/g.17714 Transcript_8904/m.17714 type:complete len:95 (+) Transcript_8904:91-375(+)|eukprot:CAMPEP_0118801888 /NCGR_PEP_ID=MMETSP1161-20130426/3280_1 /TAXON_ID=249345 /ORGANISM="Picochlorum oklahomensis, Strain CCMP2329" /LENGTH=94 /DNA_ID=CAMNT_0006729867 /DNA_START=58 /DNA_END=345 /DNA_ORIENTATION=-
MQEGDSRSIVLRVEDEDHTLGTMLSSVLWSHPHVAIAQYAQKHPVHREEISIHCQTDSQISAVQSMKDAVCMTKDMLEAIDGEMERALGDFYQN